MDSTDMRRLNQREQKILAQYATYGLGIGYDLFRRGIKLAPPEKQGYWLLLHDMEIRLRGCQEDANLRLNELSQSFRPNEERPNLEWATDVFARVEAVHSIAEHITNKLMYLLGKPIVIDTAWDQTERNVERILLPIPEIWEKLRKPISAAEKEKIMIELDKAKARRQKRVKDPKILEDPLGIPRGSDYSFIKSQRL
ncbi:MAG: hypothetical protein LBJ64_08960 [Deltaproteobacteria bacterium]|jgi:hypothetical protein|nr:hypothetical protein [Deltaproteobacteria bacterium]